MAQPRRIERAALIVQPGPHGAAGGDAQRERNDGVPESTGEKNPEYDDVADDMLCEKLRVLFNPQMTHADYCKQFLVDAEEVEDFVLPELFLKRGDAYADMGNMSRANREYDRVSLGFPKWAENAFRFENGARVRVRE